MENSKIEETQETRNEETQETPRWTYSTTNEEYSVKSKAPKENVIILWLKRIFNLKVLGTIAGIIAAVAAVKAIWPIDPVDRLIKEINEKATIIEDSFYPNEIIIEPLSSPDLQLVKNFESSTIQLVSRWKSINSMKPISEYQSFDSQEITNITASQLLTTNYFQKEIAEVLSSISSLLDYGNTNKIESYMPTKDKIAYLIEKSKNNRDFYQSTIKSVLENNSKLIEEYGSDPNGIPAKELINTYQPIEYLYKSEEPLEFIKELFSYCIELNSKYMSYLNKNGHI